MAENNLNTRIQLLYDTYTNWSTKNPKLKKGEMVQVEVPAAVGDVTQVPSILIKTGDGEHNFNDLPWTSGLAADVYDWAKAKEAPKSAWYMNITGPLNEPTGDKTPAEIYQAYTNGYAVYAVVQMADLFSGMPFILPLASVVPVSDNYLVAFSASASPRTDNITRVVSITVTWNQRWDLFIIALADADSLPVALPNPNALTIKMGDTTTTYDGSDAKNIDIPVIPTKTSELINDTFVQYTTQKLTDEQKQQARDNIGIVQADWSQNDETAADYVKNRLGGYTKTTPGYEITWDGVVGDKVVVDMGNNSQLVKVSDRVFTTEELVGATMIAGDNSTTLSDSNVVIQNGIIIANRAIAVCSAPATLESIIFPEAGMYFQKRDEAFVSSLSKPDTTTTVKIPANLLQFDPAAVLINPAKYPTDDDPRPSSPVVILYTEEMIDESGALINPPANYATGYIYVEKKYHETVTINNDLFPTGEWLSMSLDRFGENTIYDILTPYKYDYVSLSGIQSTNAGAPVVLSTNNFMEMLGTTSAPIYKENLITGVVVAIISQTADSVKALVKKIQPYEQVEFKIVTTNSSESENTGFTPITSSDKGKIIDLIAVTSGRIVGVAKCNQKNAWYARKFYVDFTSDNTVRGYFLTGYGAADKAQVLNITLAPASWTTSGNEFKYTYSNTSLRALASPIITCTSNTSEYKYITDAEATANTGIIFTAKTKPTNNIILQIIDLG